MRDSTTRFSNRVENYVKWRPSYPTDIVDVLRAECGFAPDWTVADIGSGPGNLSRLLLDFGATVIGVEPNAEMREAGDVLLHGYPQFRSIAGTAEETGLSDSSVELVTAGQAFHWFNVPEARSEFQRILNEPKWVALIWNERVHDRTPFHLAYEQLLRTHAKDYLQVEHKGVASVDAIESFFAPNPMRQIDLPYEQVFDAAGLRGRLESSSYTPTPGEPGYAEMIAETDRIFALHQSDGVIHFQYDTQIYVGRLSQ
jgi:SAM-dependent methyltransferase